MNVRFGSEQVCKVLPGLSVYYLIVFCVGGPYLQLWHGFVGPPLTEAYLQSPATRKEKRILIFSFAVKPKDTAGELRRDTSDSATWRGAREGDVMGNFARKSQEQFSSPLTSDRQGRQSGATSDEECGR